jgi:hypothetical protein
MFSQQKDAPVRFSAFRLSAAARFYQRFTQLATSQNAGAGFTVSALSGRR